MSNDKDRARLFNLMAKISTMVVEGKRSAVSVADLLQIVLVQRQGKLRFDPANYLRFGMLYAETRSQRSASVGLLDDYSKVKLVKKWQQSEASIDGELRRKRILADTAYAPLNADHFLDLRKNPEKIPEEWKEVDGMITFDGDVLEEEWNGRRNVLCMHFKGDEWCFDACRLSFSKWSDAYSAAV